MLGDGCYSECLDFGDPPIPAPCASISIAEVGWQRADGFGGHAPCPGDVFTGTDAQAQGTRLSATSFEIEAEADQTGVTDKTVEFSLFRFQGDPSQFDGLDLFRVADVVDLGLISASDVLFVTEVTGFGSVLETVDITGIPDEELVLFAAGEGPFPSETGCDTTPVPAQSTIGSAVLIGLLVLLGALAFRFRRAVTLRG